MKLEEMAGTVNLSKKEQMIFDYVLGTGKRLP